MPARFLSNFRLVSAVALVLVAAGCDKLGGAKKEAKASPTA